MHSRDSRDSRGTLLLLVIFGLAARALPVAAAESPVGDLIRKLGDGRGIRGPAIPSTADSRVADPRAASVAAALQAVLPLGGPVGVPNPAAPPAADNDSQRRAVQRLQAVVPGLQIHLRQENGTVRQIRGAVLGRASRTLLNARPGQRDEDTARGFLRSQAGLLGIRNPDAELRLDRSAPDGLGGRTLRFSQRLGALPVWPATLALHIDAAGDLTLLEGAYAPTPADAPVDPLVTADDAVFRARASVANGLAADVTDPELVLYAPLEAPVRLAWRFELNAGLASAWRFVIDARDGTILRRTSRIYDAAATGGGIDLGGASRNLNVWQQGANYYLLDTSKPMFNAGSDPILQPDGVIAIADAKLQDVNNLRTGDVDQIVSQNPNQWGIPDGVSAAYNFSQTYDYYSQEHGRNSLDGQGGTITAIVRVGNYDNASWQGNLRVMLFGTVQPYAGALDVVGHELTHGVTENSAGLVYENQSGAMNESFSDIFGEMVEAFGEGQNDWKMGTHLNSIFRDFKDPGSLMVGGVNKPYPSKLSEYIELPNSDGGDHGGVHINSSIINHAYWELAEGLTGAIGSRDASRIFYRSLTQHLQPQSQFIDLRLAAVASAEEIFGEGSTQARKVAEAFDAVEIFSAPETPEPTPLPAVQGPDSAFFISADPFFGGPTLYRREEALGDDSLGTFFSNSVLVSRPAVTGDGTIAVFVNSFYDICLADSADPTTGGCLGFAGLVHSLAVSPDGQLAAFVFRNPQTGEADNRISVINLAANTSLTFELLAPALDGVPVDAVLYADSMTFSSDGQILYYDALSRLRFGTGPTVERWSIYGLSLATGKISIVVPPIEGLDTGNPSMGRAGNRYLVFDALVESTQNSAIVGLDLFTGQAAQLAEVQTGLGYPAFTGDESALVYAQRDSAALLTGFSLLRQPLAADRLSAAGMPGVWVSDAVLGIVYRRGAFVGTNAAPVVSLTAPAAGTVIDTGVGLDLAANASDPDGTVTRVEFYDGDTRIGEDPTAPFGMSWAPQTAGEHRIVARAVDNLGASTDSSPVVVTASGGGGPGTDIRLAITAVAADTVRLVLQGPPGDYVISQSSDLREWDDIYPLTVGPSGEASLDDSGGPLHEAVLFYRARRE